MFSLFLLPVLVLLVPRLRKPFYVFSGGRDFSHTISSIFFGSCCMWGPFFLVCFAVSLFLCISGLPDHEYHQLILTVLFMAGLLLPGLYAASFRNFIIINDRKKDCFLLRAVYAVPAFSLATVFTVLLVFCLCQIVIEHYTEFGINDNDIVYGNAAFSSIISGLIVTAFFRVFLLPSSEPPELQKDFLDHDFYVYLPIPSLQNKVSQPDSPKRNSIPDDSAGIRSELKTIENKRSDILSSAWGEHVISESVSEVFQKESLSGFSIRPLVDCHRPPYQSQRKFWLLTAQNSVPPLSRLTKTTTNSFFLVSDDRFIYDRSCRSLMYDINSSDESFDYNRGIGRGIVRRPQKVLILSQKTVRIMTEQFRVPKRYFLPVYFTDDGNGTDAVSDVPA